MQSDPTTDRTILLNRIADAASDLCDARRHSEPRGYYWDRNRNRKPLPPHTTTMPGLLAQLRDAVTPTVTGTNTAGGHAASRPPCNVDAISRHATIAIAVVRWCWNHRVELRDTTEANISALVGAAGSMTSDEQEHLLVDLRTWRSWANLAIGWTTPPVTPAAPCPVCGAWSALRVRVDRDGDKLTPRGAYCRGSVDRECDAVWDDDQAMAALADHIAAYSRGSHGRALEARRLARREQDERDRERFGARLPAA